MDEQARLASRVSAPVEREAEPLRPGADEKPGTDGTGPMAEETPETLPDWGEAALDWGEAPGAVKQLAQAFKMASRSGLFKRDPELRRLFKDNETLLTYLAHQEEIQAASEKLEPYHAEFDRLCHDAAAYDRQTKALFAEPAFAPFRFTAADLRRAFAEVGVPALDGASRKTGKLLRKALLFLATKERRDELGLRLLLLVPGYVQQGRHLDALLIEGCAQMTAEETDEPNPFLGRMFLYGLEAWGAEQDASREAVLEEGGFRFGPDADPEEVESWLDKQMADPESAVMCATSAILYVEHEAEPEMNSFLIGLCARSVMKCGGAAERKAGGAGGDNQATA